MDRQKEIKERRDREMRYCLLGDGASHHVNYHRVRLTVRAHIYICMDRDLFRILSLIAHVQSGIKKKDKMGLHCLSDPN